MITNCINQDNCGLVRNQVVQRQNGLLALHSKAVELEQGVFIAVSLIAFEWSKCGNVVGFILMFIKGQSQEEVRSSPFRRALQQSHGAV